MPQSLVSPGVEVSVTDQSFYIPASAPTVPLIFVATEANKMQPDGTTTASATNEHGVIRTVTSIGQSIQLYGIPSFRADNSGNQFHGDSRNEYGLFALNQFLGIGNLAYVVRANVDLADASETFIGLGTPVADTATFVGVGDGTLTSVTATSAFVKPETITIGFTTPTEFTVSGDVSGVIGFGTTTTPFTSNKVNFTVTVGATAFVAGDYFELVLEYAPSSFTGTGDGKMTGITISSTAIADTITVDFTSATDFTVTGTTSGAQGTGTVGTLFTTTDTTLTFLISAGTTAFALNDQFVLTLSEVNVINPLGATDADKRETIVAALRSQIISNSDVRAENYQYNLILCPGYHEVVTNLIALSEDIFGEAFVIADTRSTDTVERAAAWAATQDHVSSTSVAYYYPWCQAANLDGTLVTVAPSGVALSTYAFSDNNSYVWFAPAGVRRGMVLGVNYTGYISGTLGQPNTFVKVNLNQGQRDQLYQYGTSINPIVFFPGTGMVIWGQKTAAHAASALDRVNVVRLIMYLKRQLRIGALPFVFEPNDPITRANLKAATDALLNRVMSNRGLYDFVTQCDENNNGPSVIENNELHLDVGVSPTKAAEFVYVNINVMSATATS